MPINMKNERGEGVLHAALKIENATKRQKMFHYLLNRGADYLAVDPLSEMDILQWACYLGHTEQVKQLVQFATGDLDYRRKDLRGRTAVHLATLRGDPVMVQVICREMRRVHLSVDITDKDKLTPYLLAQRLGFTEVADVLEKTGGASCSQFDTRTFRNSTEWSKHGRIERQRQEEQRVFAALKLNGRDPNQTAIGNKQQPVNNFSHHKSHRLEPIPNIQVHGQVRAKKKKLIADDSEPSSTDTHLVETGDSHSLVTTDTVARVKRSSEIDDILAILVEQLSTSYRKPAPPPPPKIPTLLSLKRVSTLAVIMNRLQTRSRNIKIQNAVMAMVKGKGKGGDKKHALVNAVKLMNKNKMIKLRAMSKQDIGSPESIPYKATNNANS